MKIIQIGAKVGAGKGIGHGNAGDTAIGAAFNFLFESEFPDSDITFLNCRQIFTKNEIDLINQNDVLFLSGGGLFLHDTFPNNVSDWQWGISVDLLDEIKIPIVVYAVGYNKFRKQRNFTKHFDQTVNKLVDKSIFFSLRNSGSCNAIKQHINSNLFSKISLNFCPTMMLNKKFDFHHKPCNNIGFVLAGDRLANRHEDLKSFVTHISNFVNYLKKNKIKSILINHQNDLWIKKFIDFDEIIDLFGASAEKIYQTYSQIDTVICDRGHAQMIPFSLGCKIISPISHNKLGWFLGDMNAKKFGIEENDPKLYSKLVNAYNDIQKSNWTETNQTSMEKVYRVNTKNIELIKTKLTNI